MSGLELPKLPRSWAWTTLSQIAALIGGVTKGQKHNPAAKTRVVPYLRVANVQRGRLDLKEIKSIQAKEEDIEALRLRPGDVLFNEGGDRDKLGRGWVWDGQIPECIHQNHVFRARLSSRELLPKLVSHWGNSFGQRWFMKAGKQSVNLASINLTNLRAFPVPVPPAAEQARILDTLDELLSDLDAAIVALERTQVMLKQYRAAVLKAAVQGALTAKWRERHPTTEPASTLLARILAERRRRWEETQLKKFKEADKEPPKNWKAKYREPAAPDATNLAPLPGKWCWATPAQIGDVQLGRQRAPQHHSGKFMRPYLRVANVYEDRIDLRSIYEMNFTPEEFETFQLQPGDVLLNEGQSLELVGRAAIYRGELPGACFTNTLVRFRAHQGILPEFALIYFKACLRNHRFRKLARWTTNIAHLGADRFAAMELPLPPIAEQEAIVEAVEDQLSVIDHLDADLEVKLKSAQTLRQSILRHAFTGQLVPQDPNDEPASKLLERIAAERAERERQAREAKPVNKVGRARRARPGHAPPVPIRAPATA